MSILHHPLAVARKLAFAGSIALLIVASSATAAFAQTPDVQPGGSNPIVFLPNDVVPVTPKPPANPAGQNSMLFLPALTNGSSAAQAETLSAGATGDVAGDIAAAKAQQPASKLLIDTDPGVDDSVALTWLFTQRDRPLQFLGVVTVAGNTTVQNATNNAVLVLNQLDRKDVPVVMGAAAPLVQPLTKTTWFIHGPDGLWFLGMQNPQDLSRVRTGAPSFYCETVAANPGVRILALGPLTNIAQAIDQCPDTMKTVGQVVILGGAKFGGNKTVVAEFNFWQDPEAVSAVLSAELPVTLVLFDAFVQPTIDQKDLNKLFSKGIPAIKFLSSAIQQYANVQLANTGRAGIPDAVAAVLALQSEEGTRTSALIKMVLQDSLARGQSIVGLTAGEKVTMIATDQELSDMAELAFTDPTFDFPAALGAILMSEPDNAIAVTGASTTLLSKTVFPYLYAQ
jgi:inosine-uridine nucleoside N-ribohydrolase